jgi:ADP-ribosylglycohydrolase
MVLIIKPTKHNKRVMKNRGLFSDDSQLYFDIYESIISESIFKINDIDNCLDYFINDLIKIGIRF